jgi:hypothetical protein
MAYAILSNAYTIIAFAIFYAGLGRKVPLSRRHLIIS